MYKLTPWISNHQRLLVWVGLGLLFVLYSYTNIFHTSWLLHPDDHEYYLFGRSLAEGAGFSLPALSPEKFPYQVFAPSGTIVVDDVIVPKRSLGMYFVTALAYAIRPGLVFWIVPILSTIGAAFLFKLLRRLSDLQGALIGTFLFAASFPAIYWSNMLYPNMPAIVCYVIVTYLLVLIHSMKSISRLHYLLMSLVLTASIWFRYESIVFVILALAIAWLLQRHHWRRMIIVTLIVITLCLPILYFNNQFYGSPFAFGYTVETSTAVTSATQSTLEQEETGIEPVDDIARIYRRFFVHTFFPNIHLISKNIWDWVISFYPAFSTLGILALSYLILARKYALLPIIPLLVFATLWVYSNAGGILWGFNTDWLGNSYIRYFLSAYLGLAILIGISIGELQKRVSRRILQILLVCVLASTSVINIGALFTGPYGLLQTNQRMVENYAIHQLSLAYPEYTIFIGTLEGKHIVDRPFLNPMHIPEEQRRSTTVEYAHVLLTRGYRVILLESSGHPSFSDIEGALSADSRFSVFPSSEHPSLHEVGLRTTF